MNRVNAIELAEFILASYGHRVPISPMKLQKLAYYAKAWSIVAEKNFIDADFVRWNFGPVNRVIYDRYKHFARCTIPAPPEGSIRLSPDQEDFIRFVVDRYVDLNAVALSMQTHREDPWIDTPPNRVISDQKIKEYYSKQNFAKNFERQDFKKGQFFVMKTNSWHSFTMDMDSNESSYFESYPSYDDYLASKERASQEMDDLIRELFGDSVQINH